VSQPRPERSAAKRNAHHPAALLMDHRVRPKGRNKLESEPSPNPTRRLRGGDPSVKHSRNGRVAVLRTAHHNRLADNVTSLGNLGNDFIENQPSDAR
jgi:hypothetical protein